MYISDSFLPVTAIISTSRLAAGLLQNVVGFIFIMLTNQAAKKIEPDSALF
ncbi:hypothetical protein FACS1894202_12170 [Clostridia bacterium]|nr:hypothetical protein FACS1894202_12170 [Clostridia bacterium]